MYIYDLTDIIFFIKSIKFPSEKFNILDYVEFGSGHSYQISRCKIEAQDCTHKQYDELLFLSFTQTVEQYTNNLSNSLPAIKSKLKNYFWHHFIKNFDNNNFCTFFYLCPCSKCMKTPAPANYSFL